MDEFSDEFPVVDDTLAHERGCKQPFVIDPHWVDVMDEAIPGRVVAEGIVRKSSVTHHDWHGDHSSHDWNVYLELDPTSSHLHSPANEWQKLDDGRTVQLIEVEWEIDCFPERFRPIPDDEAWMMGRWMFDCGHPPYRTEIHPPKAVAFTRLQPAFLANDSSPSVAKCTYLYLRGRGSYKPSPITETPIGDQVYELAVTLPESPAGTTGPWAGIISALPGGHLPDVALDHSFDPPKTRIRLDLTGVELSADDEIGCVIASGWRGVTPSPGFLELDVTFESMHVNHGHDALPFDPGDWNLWAHVNGSWIELTRSSLLGSQVGIRDRVITFQDKTVRVLIAEDDTLEIGTTGWESDIYDDLFEGPRQLFRPATVIDTVRDKAREIRDYLEGVVKNNRIGVVSRSHGSTDRFGVGASHDAVSLRNGDAATNGDFSLRYRVDFVRRVPARSEN